MHLLQHLWSNWDDVLAGGTALGLFSHLINTFPPPNNPYGKWILGGAQWFVGQRAAASATFASPTIPKG